MLLLWFTVCFEARFCMLLPLCSRERSNAHKPVSLE